MSKDPNLGRRSPFAARLLLSGLATSSLTVASAATITLNDGNTQNYTPASTAASGAVDIRNFDGITSNDTSAIDFRTTALSVGTNTNLALAAETPINTATQLVGQLEITTGGTYTFSCASDDGSRLFIDGILVVSNEGGHSVETRTGTITLDAGRHEIRVDYVNTAGGGALTVEYSGADNSDSMGPIPISALFRAENSASVSTTVSPNTTVLLGDDITVSASAYATINLAGTAFANASLTSLNAGADSSLNVTGTADRDLRFDTTTFNGASTYTFDTVPDLALGEVSGTAAGTTIVKQGSGRLILDNTSDTSANDFTGTTFDLQTGELHVIGSSVTGATNPLGDAAVQLNGGMLALDSAFGNMTLDNSISLAGNGGTIRTISGPRVYILDSLAPIDIGAGQTLTMETQLGSLRVNGTTLSLNTTLTGTGELEGTQTSVGDSTQTGFNILTGDSPSFSGPVTLTSGVLEGRFSGAGTKPFGTGVITMNGGSLYLRGMDAADNIVYTPGNDLTLAESLTVNVAAGSGGGINGEVQMGSFSSDGVYSLTVNSANGYGLTFADATLGGDTNFIVQNGGTVNVGNVGESVPDSNFRKTGDGIIVLGDNSTYTGWTQVDDGVVEASTISDTGNSSIGNGPGKVIINNGATLRYTGTGAASTSRFIDVAFNNEKIIEVVEAGASLELSGNVNGSGIPLTKSGPGTLILSGVADNNSLIFSAQAGITQLNKSVAGGTRAVAGISDIAAGATVQLTGFDSDQVYDGATSGEFGNLGMSGGTFDLNERSERFSRMNGTGLVTNEGSSATTSTITTGSSNGSGTFLGSIQDGASGGKVAFRKIGSGVQTIAFNPDGLLANTYTGGTTISDGTLLLEGPPTAPVAGSALWLDAADAGTVTLDSGMVSQWDDKSGNARHATQGTPGNRPGYINNSEVGGLPVLDFDGDDTLSVDLSFLAESDYTIFVVEGKQETGQSYLLGTSSASQTNHRLHVGYRDNDSFALAHYSNDFDYSDTALEYDGSTQVFRQWTASLATASGKSIALNGGTPRTNTQTVQMITADNGIIGTGFGSGGQLYNGDISEIIIYPSSLSDADREIVENYLEAKWFGTLSNSNFLPTDTALNIDGSAATLDLNGVDQQLGSLDGVAGSLITLGDASLTVGNSLSANFAGSISGTGGFAKVGTGTQSLSGANTYIGDTTVTTGTLSLGDGTNNSALEDTADVVVETDAVLDLNYTGTDTIDELTLGGVAKFTGVWGATGSGATFIDDTFFTGTGTLTVTTGPAPTAYVIWAVANGLAGSDALDTTDVESDGLVNLLEFGFGTDPNVADSAPLVADGSMNGVPIIQQSGTGGGATFDALFVRRDDHGTSGSVSYTAQFSSDLGTFYDSAETPTFVADSSVDAAYEVVSLTYPSTLLPNGKMARFFRIKVDPVP